MVCWNRCGPAVLSYQTNWLTSWTLVIVSRKDRRRRKTRNSLTDDFIETGGESCSDNYHLEALDREVEVRQLRKDQSGLLFT